ncbi:MAG: polysaccharide deacetylase family protein, partial [Candidatus Methylomirabilales bacterium]
MAERPLWVGAPVFRFPWNGSRPRCAAAGFLLILVAWPVAGGRAPETRATGPARPMARASTVTLAVPAPSPVVPVTQPILPLSVEDLTRGSRSMPEIAFTFDGHDGANAAGEILDILQARGVRVTLFLGGRFIRKFPDLVRRMVAEGHEIASRLDTHRHLTAYAQNRRQETLPGVTREVVISELRRAEASFRAVTGRPLAPYWRAPYGEHNAEIRAWAAGEG